MPLRIVADRLDELPEGLRDGAKQEGALFVAKELPAGWAVEDVAGIKKALSDTRSERDAAKRAVAKFEGIDPEHATEAREALEQLRAGTLRGSKEIDAYKASVEKKMADERAKLEAKLNARTAALRDRMVKGELAPHIAKLGGSESMDAILTLAQQSIRVEEDADGNLKHSIVDASGKPRVTKRSGSSDPMGLDELIVEMRDAPPTRGLFKTTATGGSGGTSQSGGSGGRGNQGQQNLSARELLARAHAKAGTSA